MRTLQELNTDGRLGFWIDTDEQPLGPNVLWATWIGVDVNMGPLRALDYPPKAYARINAATLRDGKTRRP